MIISIIMEPLANCLDDCDMPGVLFIKERKFGNITKKEGGELTGELSKTKMLKRKLAKSFITEFESYRGHNNKQ